MLSSYFDTGTTFVIWIWKVIELLEAVPWQSLVKVPVIVVVLALYLTAAPIQPKYFTVAAAVVC